MSIRAVAAAVLLSGVAGCGPLVQIGGNDPAPVALLQLRASAPPAGPTSAVDRAATVLVTTPSVPGPLQTLRLPVTTADTQIAYLTGATWAEQPNKQFQRLLADTIEARGIPVLDPRQSRVGAGRSLSGTLVEFGLDVRAPAAAVVRVRYDATLIGPEAAVATRRFDTVLPVASQIPNDVGIALNTAANRLAADVAAWIVTIPVAAPVANPARTPG